MKKMFWGFLVILNVVALMLATTRYVLRVVEPTATAEDTAEHTILPEPKGEDIYLVETIDGWATAYYFDGEQVAKEFNPWVIFRILVNAEKIHSFSWITESNCEEHFFRFEGEVQRAFEKHAVLQLFPGENRVTVTYMTVDGEEHNCSFTINLVEA